MNPRTSVLVACLAAVLAQTTVAQLAWVRRDFPMGSGHQMVYDAARGRVVLFGGTLSGPALADTWEWDGVSWTLVEPAVRPPARGGHAMAYDSVRNGRFHTQFFRFPWQRLPVPASIRSRLLDLS